MRTYSRFTRRILSSILAALLCISSAMPAAAAGSCFESSSERVLKQAADTGVVTSPRSLALADAAENAAAAASSTSDPDFTFTKVTDTYSTDDPVPNLATTLDLTKYAVVRNYNFSYTAWVDTGYTDGDGNVVAGGSGSGTATPEYRFEVVPVEYLTTGWSVTSVDENRSGVKAGDLLFDREIDIVGNRPFHIEADAVVKKPSDLCLIRFDYDGGALPDGQTDLGGAFFMAGQKIDPNLLPEPVKEGCIFKGWEMSWFDPYELVDKTGAWTNDSILAADTTFKALWESNAQSMVTLRDLVIDMNNRELVGFTSETMELDIPARFEAQNPYGSGKIVYTVVGIADGAFTGCDILMSVSIPDTVTSIGYGAFAGCKSLVGASLPDTLETLGDHAFDGCTALKTVNIPKGISEIRPFTFNECENLDNVAIPGNVKTIGDNAFYGCEYLSIISFEAGLETIGAQAFMNAVGLGGGNGNGRITLPSGLKEIGPYAFHGCAAMSANTEADPFVIPGSVVNIGDMAFEGCTNLTYIRVEDGVRTIGSNVFSCIPDCMLTLPDSLESVADDACDSMCDLHYHGDLANKPFGASRMIAMSYASNDDGTHMKSCARCGVLSVAETCDTAGTDGVCSKCGALWSAPPVMGGGEDPDFEYLSMEQQILSFSFDETTSDQDGDGFTVVTAEPVDLLYTIYGFDDYRMAYAYSNILKPPGMIGVFDVTFGKLKVTALDVAETEIDKDALIECWYYVPGSDALPIISPRINFKLPPQIPTSGDGWEYIGETEPVSGQDFPAKLVPYYSFWCDYEIYVKIGTGELLQLHEDNDGAFIVPGTYVDEGLTIEVITKSTNGLADGKAMTVTYSAGLMAVVFEPVFNTEIKDRIANEFGMPYLWCRGRAMYPCSMKIDGEEKNVYVTLFAARDRDEQADILYMCEDWDRGNGFSSGCNFMATYGLDDGSNTLATRIHGDLNNDGLVNAYDTTFLINVFRGAGTIVDAVSSVYDEYDGIAVDLQIIQNCLTCDLTKDLKVDSFDFVHCKNLLQP